MDTAPRNPTACPAGTDRRTEQQGWAAARPRRAPSYPNHHEGISKAMSQEVRLIHSLPKHQEKSPGNPLGPRTQHSHPPQPTWGIPQLDPSGALCTWGLHGPPATAPAAGEQQLQKARRRPYSTHLLQTSPLATTSRQRSLQSTPATSSSVSRLHKIKKKLHVQETHSSRFPARFNAKNFLLPFRLTQEACKHSSPVI